MSKVRALHTRVPHVGRLVWIGLRPGRGEAMKVVREAVLEEGRGLVEDRAGKRRGAKRQVSLIQAEHLEVVARLQGRAEVDPALTRRNLVVEGINLRSLTKQRIRVGSCVLEWSGECYPCSKMETALGEGGYAAMRGHGGILARVLEGGTIRVGDAVTRAASDG